MLGQLCEREEVHTPVAVLGLELSTVALGDAQLRAVEEIHPLRDEVCSPSRGVAKHSLHPAAVGAVDGHGRIAKCWRLQLCLADHPRRLWGGETSTFWRIGVVTMATGAELMG